MVEGPILKGCADWQYRSERSAAGWDRYLRDWLSFPAPVSGTRASSPARHTLIVKCGKEDVDAWTYLFQMALRCSQLPNSLSSSLPYARDHAERVQS